MSITLPDIQKTADTRNVHIDRVGVCGIKMPIRIQVPNQDGLGHTLADVVGEFELTCFLPDNVKGTHMSRFTEVLNEHVDETGVFSHEHLQSMAAKLATRLGSSHVFIKLEMDYFFKQTSPVSKRKGVAPIKAVLIVEHSAGSSPQVILTTGIVINGKTCCPCSREISSFDHETGKGKGAHAQRGTITLRVKHTPAVMVWFEELIQVCLESFSSPVYPVLKRPDEKHVTEHAYGNPKFVEDVIRDVVVNLRKLESFDKILDYAVRVQNAESIHYHDAVAQIGTL